RSPSAAGAASLLPLQLDLNAVVVARAHVDLALDRAIARTHDLDAVAPGSKPQVLDAAARAPELAVDVHGGVRRLEVEAQRARLRVFPIVFGPVGFFAVAGALVARLFTAVVVFVAIALVLPPVAFGLANHLVRVLARAALHDVMELQRLARRHVHTELVRAIAVELEADLVAAGG